MLFEINKKDVLSTGLDGRRRQTLNKVRSSSPGKANTHLCEINRGASSSSSVIFPRRVPALGRKLEVESFDESARGWKGTKNGKDKSQCKNVGFGWYLQKD